MHFNMQTRKIKTKYFRIKLQNSTNTKDSWKIKNELLNKKSKITTIKEIIINHNMVTEDENIANEFNNFFCKIGPELAEDIPQIDRDPILCDSWN